MWKPQKPPFREYKKKVFAKAASVTDLIYQIGESQDLRKPSPEVSLAEITTPDFQKKLEYLKTCLQEYRKLTGMGRGITGVQVGIPERVAIIYLGSTTGIKSTKGTKSLRLLRFARNDLLIIINPVITKQSTTMLRYPEICMSANPIIAPVIRPSWIEFSYRDETGKEQEWKTKDDTNEGRIYNRVFQHEIDHMDGIINIDRVQSKELIFESDPSFYDTAKFEKVRNKSQ